MESNVKFVSATRTRFLHRKRCEGRPLQGGSNMLFGGLRIILLAVHDGQAMVMFFSGDCKQRSRSETQQK